MTSGDGLHDTNKAFDRYLQNKADDARKIYTFASSMSSIKNISQDKG